MLLIQGLALFVPFYFKLKGSVLGCLQAGKGLGKRFSVCSSMSLVACRVWMEPAVHLGLDLLRIMKLQQVSA